MAGAATDAPGDHLMPTYTAPLRDMRFVLNELAGAERLRPLPGCEEVGPDLIDPVLEQAAKFCAEILLPINRSGDEEGCTRHADGSVTTPKGFKEAYDQFVAGGWTTLHSPEQYGGEGASPFLPTPGYPYFLSANQAVVM